METRYVLEFKVFQIFGRWNAKYYKTPSVRSINTHNVGVPEWEATKKRAEKKFEEIMAEYFQNLMKDEYKHLRSSTKSKRDELKRDPNWDIL